MNAHRRDVVAGAAEHQFLVRLLDGHTACISLPASASLCDLQAHIERSYAIPASQQRFVCHGRLLHDETDQHKQRDTLSTQLSALCLHSHDSYLTLLLSLPGGKGGFGSLLRATTARVGVKRTSDFSAMRDLHGRRMRHVEQDKELQRWEQEMEGKSEEEKKRLRQELTTKMTRIKRGQRVEDRKKCRWGAQCKYKYKCRGSHPEEAEADGRESGRGVGLGVGSWQAAVVDEEDIMDDLQSALKGNEHKEEKEQHDDGEDDDDGESEAEQSDDEQKDGSSRSRRQVWDDELLLEDDDEEVAQGKSDSGVERKEESKQWSKRSGGERDTVEDDEKEEQNKPHDSQKRRHSDRPQDEQKEEMKELPNEQRDARDGQSSSTDTSTQPTSSSPSTAPPSSATSATRHPSIDLSQHTTAASLHVYGMEHLRADLDRVGLKCGGTLTERAERLFMLKDHTLQQMPKKMLKR